MSPDLARVACIVPARDAQDSIAATVTAAALLRGVEVVIVCDDGSSDATAQHASAAGAIVVSHERSRGKAAAVESAVNGLGVLEQRDDRREAGTLLLLDADVGAGTAACSRLLEPVVAGRAAMSVGVPAGTSAEGDPEASGSGLVVDVARRGIAELTATTVRAPLSGVRCLTRRAFELASPLAAGWGMDVGMTVDLLRAGLVVTELELDLPDVEPAHDLGRQLRRAAQLRDVTRALAARGWVRSQLKELGTDGVPGLLKRLGRVR